MRLRSNIKRAVEGLGNTVNLPGLGGKASGLGRQVRLKEEHGWGFGGTVRSKKCASLVHPREEKGQSLGQEGKIPVSPDRPLDLTLQGRITPGRVELRGTRSKQS